jgi:hypothetical protein
MFRIRFAQWSAVWSSWLSAAGRLAGHLRSRAAACGRAQGADATRISLSPAILQLWLPWISRSVREKVDTPIRAPYRLCSGGVLTLDLKGSRPPRKAGDTFTSSRARFTRASTTAGPGQSPRVVRRREGQAGSRARLSRAALIYTVATSDFRAGSIGRV